MSAKFSKFLAFLLHNPGAEIIKILSLSHDTEGNIIVAYSR